MFHHPGNRVAGVKNEMLRHVGKLCSHDVPDVSAFNDLSPHDAASWIKVRAVAGTIVSIPTLWWHHVKAEEDSLSLAVAVRPLDAVNKCVPSWRSQPSFSPVLEFVPSDEALIDYDSSDYAESLHLPIGRIRLDELPGHRSRRKRTGTTWSGLGLGLGLELERPGQG